MRQISISTEVFAAIWTNRRSGEETEDEILKRLLNDRHTDLPLDGHPNYMDTTAHIEGATGHLDLRSGTVFPAGFEIFRIYKGNEYRAKAVGGVWVLSSTGTGYLTLNRLSRQGLGIASENAWQNWYFMDASGKRALIASLKR